jgi:hypothetical protein
LAIGDWRLAIGNLQSAIGNLQPQQRPHHQGGAGATHHPVVEQAADEEGGEASGQAEAADSIWVADSRPGHPVEGDDQPEEGDEA